MLAMGTSCGATWPHVCRPRARGSHVWFYISLMVRRSLSLPLSWGLFTELPGRLAPSVRPWRGSRVGSLGLFHVPSGSREPLLHARAWSARLGSDRSGAGLDRCLACPRPLSPQGKITHISAELFPLCACTARVGGPYVSYKCLPDPLSLVRFGWEFKPL